MFEQRTFHFGTIDVLTAAQHHVFDSINYEQEIVLVFAGNIAGA